MGEAQTSPAPGITRRYPDRLIINVTNICACIAVIVRDGEICGESDRHETKERLLAALGYIRANPEIRDVLVTGGDALLLSDNTLDWLLGELHKIPHVEIKRLGTRVPVTLPMRVTDHLLKVLAKYPPIFIIPSSTTRKRLPWKPKGCGQTRIRRNRFGKPGSAA
jgi:lysine 2,3-aminomutase